MNIDIYQFIARALVLLTAIPIHESAHAYISYKLGDPTAKNMGRLTMNPIKHLDPIGSICLLAAGFGWAKPVPVDPRYYKNRKSGMALTALAGPVSNILMAFCGLVIYKILYYSFWGSTSSVFAFALEVSYYIMIINVTLALFNLIPIPPFDGSRILGFFLPEKAYFGIMRYERYIFAAVFAIMLLSRFVPIVGEVIGRPFNAVFLWIVDFLFWVTGFVDKIAIAILT